MATKIQYPVRLDNGCTIHRTPGGRFYALAPHGGRLDPDAAPGTKSAALALAEAYTPDAAPTNGWGVVLPPTQDPSVPAEEDNGWTSVGVDTPGGCGEPYPEPELVSPVPAPTTRPVPSKHVRSLFRRVRRQAFAAAGLSLAVGITVLGLAWNAWMGTTL